MGAEVSVRGLVAAPADLVWTIVSDVTRTSSWSPDVVGCRWLDGASGPALGARFAGSSARGPLHRWSTTSTVTSCEPGRTFGYHVRYAGLSVAHWSWTTTPHDGGCLVTHAWADRRHLVVRQGSSVVTGVRDRRAYNEAAMRRAVEAVKALAEKQAQA